MVVGLAQDQARGGGPRTTFAASALPALDGLTLAERAAVFAALEALEQAPAPAVAALHLARLNVPSEPDLFALRPTERLRLVVRILPDGAIEVLELVRPETLQHLFAPAAPDSV